MNNDAMPLMQIFSQRDVLNVDTTVSFWALFLFKKMPRVNVIAESSSYMLRPRK